MNSTDAGLAQDADLTADAVDAGDAPVALVAAGPPARPARTRSARASSNGAAAKGAAANGAASSNGAAANGVAAKRAAPGEPSVVGPPRWLSDEQQRDWRAFYYAIVRLQEALDRDLLHGFGIPHGYYEIFVRLSEAPDRSMRMSELASATRSSRSRLSHAVARLEEAGWVVRESCETDRRGQIARLTDSGLELLIRAAPSHLESVRAYLIDPLTDGQLRQLGDIGRVVFDSIPD